MGFSAVKVGCFTQPILRTKGKEIFSRNCPVSTLDNPSPRHQNGAGYIHIHIDFCLWLIAAFVGELGGLRRRLEVWTFQLRCH